jgi:catechol 2,3-dioxygenase-like lactoylglutathione lyase family enzyme
MPAKGGRIMRFLEDCRWPLYALCGLGLAVESAAHGGASESRAIQRTAVRYQVADVQRSVAFYTRQLGFTVSLQNGPIAAVTGGGLMLILSGPGASGTRPMPDGRNQMPGGWNRIIVYVDDLKGDIARLTKAGVHFRNKLEVGPGGSQILIDDPDGNPVELHEAPRSERK